MLVCLLIVLLLLIAIPPLGLFISYLYCIRMPGSSFTGAQPALTEAEAEIQEHARQHVYMLAEQIGERHSEKPQQLQQAAEYIHAELSALGYAVTEQMFDDGRFRNIVCELPGKTRPEEIVVVGAHYDTVWLTPGADDNASGITGVLELARLLKDEQPDRTLRFIAFVNEESPFYGTDSMGSMVSAKASRRAGENIVVMFSLEMIGYFLTEPGSQHYPRVVRQFYPDTADFIAFVGNLRSGSQIRRAVKYFRQEATIGSAGLIAVEKVVPDIRRSDHAAYWRNGYPAMMVTDTSNYRNPNYHTETDTGDTLDYERMTRVINGMAAVLRRLAGVSG
ncbi:MAG: M20/M25/M40 family metallo-hydrolase [Gammaproteobacteria bacterium]